MKSWLKVAVVLSLVVVAFGAQAAEKVRAWQEDLVIPTYPWQPEDVNPRFPDFDNSIIYPYTMQDNLSTEKVDRAYKVLCLENEYLKVVCIPELGGRIHSVLDKTTNEETFHLNKVIKPGLIAMRGAWISGGIEWNTGPHGHTVGIVAPVDGTLLENPDGSATLVVGNTEKIFRTRWTVRVTLRPGKAYLEEQIRIANPTDGIHPYYFWNNTAFPCRQGTRYIYPMTLGTDHFGRDFFSWPVHEGRDMTWLKNYEDMTSTFSYKCVYDFFGAYDVDMDRGIVQFADHGAVPGKKAWTWGQAEFGLVSQESLTDEDGPYIEVQSGPLATQSDYEFLEPRQQVAWEEWWYPVHGLGDGFEYATKDAAVQSYRRDGSLELRILGTGDFPGARCLVSKDGNTLVDQALDLSPRAPQTVRLDKAPESVDVQIVAADGAVLAAYTSPLPIPKETPPTFPEEKPEDQLGPEELFLKAERLDKDTSRAAARDGYAKVLARDPQHAGALRALAVLDLESGLYDAARERLEKAVARRVDDSLAWGLLGLAYLGLNNLDQAVENAYRGARLLDASGFCWEVAGRAHMRKGAYAEAVEDFQRAVAANPNDARAKDRLMLALALAERLPEADAVAAQRLADDPFAILPVMQEARRSPEQPAAAPLGTLQERLGEPEFEMLDAAWICADAGLNNAAYTIASAILRPTALTHYQAAWFAHLSGQESRAEEHLRRARTETPDYVFPSFPESIPAFQFAVEQNPKDSHARFALGNLYAGLGRLDEAVPCWEKATELNSSLSVAFRNLAMHAWKKQNDVAKAETLLAKAIAARPDDEILYRDRAQALIELGRRPEAIDLLVNRPTGDRPRTDTAILLARAYVDEKRYDDAVALLENSNFSNWEGQMDSWNLFNRSHVERGKLRFEAKDYEAALSEFSAALTYPKNLRVGRPVHSKLQEGEAQYWKGRALQALGRLDEARAAWKEGAAGPDTTEEQKKHRDLCAQALELLSTP